MKPLASLDIYFVKQEFDRLLNAKVDKIYQPDEDTMMLQLHKDGKQIINITLPSFIFIATAKSAGRQLPFSVFLRKHLANHYLTRIEQKNFERILEFEFSLNEDRKILIIELFSKGNVILCDENYNIISPLRVQKWKDRTIRPKEQYKYPPRGIDPFGLSLNEFSSMIRLSDKESIVKILAIDFSFGGIYSEEVCFRSNIEKSKKSLSDSEIKSIYKAMQEIKSIAPKPNIVHGQAFPFELAQYKNESKKFFSTFSEAIEECINIPEKTVSKEKEKLLNLLEVQKKQLEGIKKSIEDETQKGNMIYNNYQLINSLLYINDLDKLKSMKPVIEVNKKEKTFTINIENRNITLNINLSIDRNASIFYEKAKKMKSKVAGAESALQKTIQRLTKMDSSEKLEVKKERQPERKREWYEKFRWFISSEGFLVIGGRDATTNDIIIKKHLEKNDLVFHTEMKGSPFVVIKAGSKKPGAATMEEAAVFCASNSKQWDANLATSDVYCISPDQVKKELGLPKGTFMIYGKRTYFRPILKLAIGITNDFKVMCAPVSAVKANCRNMILINQGDVKKSDIAKKIKKKFEEELKIKLNLDEIMQALPPGNSSILLP